MTLLNTQLRYEPPGYGPSWWDINKPDCIKEYKELSCTSKVLVVILSTIMIGGGTLGCFAAAGAFTSSGEFIKNGPRTAKNLVPDNTSINCQWGPWSNCSTSCGQGKLIRDNSNCSVATLSVVQVCKKALDNSFIGNFFIISFQFKNICYLQKMFTKYGFHSESI